MTGSTFRCDRARRKGYLQPKPLRHSVLSDSGKRLFKFLGSTRVFKHSLGQITPPRRYFALQFAGQQTQRGAELVVVLWNLLSLPSTSSAVPVPTTVVFQNSFLSECGPK